MNGIMSTIGIYTPSKENGEDDVCGRNQDEDSEDDFVDIFDALNQVAQQRLPPLSAHDFPKTARDEVAGRSPHAVCFEESWVPKSAGRPRTGTTASTTVDGVVGNDRTERINIHECSRNMRVKASTCGARGSQPKGSTDIDGIMSVTGIDKLLKQNEDPNVVGRRTDEDA